MDKKLLVVIKREFMERVRTRAFLITTLIVPVLLAAMVLLPAYFASRSRASSKIANIVIVDATRAGVGERVSAALMSDPSILRDTTITVRPPQVRAVAPAELAAAESVAVREVQTPDALTGVLVLGDTVLRGGPARYAGRNATSMADIDRIRGAVRQAVMMTRLGGAGVEPAVIDSLTSSPVRLLAERVDDRGRGGSGQMAIVVGFIIAFFLYMSIILHGQNVMRGVLEEKTTRVAEVVLSSVKPDTLLAGKVLGVGAVGLTQQIVWLGVGVYLTQFLLPLIIPAAAAAPQMPAGDPAAGGGIAAAFGALNLTAFVIVLLYFLAGFIFYASLYAAAGAMVNSEQEAQQAAIPVMMLLVGTIVLITPVMEQPNGTLAVVLSWLPFSSPIIMPTRVLLGGIPWTHVAGSLLVAFGGCVAAVWLAARIYRVGMLMYGKKPTFGELMRWVRYAR